MPMRQVSESPVFAATTDGDGDALTMHTAATSIQPQSDSPHHAAPRNTMRPLSEDDDETTASSFHPPQSQHSVLSSRLGSQHTRPQVEPNQRLQSPLFADHYNNTPRTQAQKPPTANDSGDEATEAYAISCHYNNLKNEISADAKHFKRSVNKDKGDTAAEEVDPAHGAILIYPKKIDNLRRFRILFVGILLFISSSTQGLHSLFGTLYLQVIFRYDVRKMAIVYLCGQAFGMFVFPFGMLYDWFGPRIVVATGSTIAALGHLLFALTFGGHLEPTVVNCAVFYSIMCWGCYALDVTVLPAVLSHMPRDRGQPTGLLETFSGLGSSFFSCLFRGFFANDFENLMWFMFAVTVVVGVVGTWYLEDAPYVVNRWQQRRITPREQLRKYLIRNRYMSQLVPRRRYMLLSLVLILMNFYLTIQAVVVAYLADQMTDGKRRGIAIGAIVIFLFIFILVIPVDAIDGPTEQDKQVIEAAKEKEVRVREIHAEYYRQAAHRTNEDGSNTNDESTTAPNAQHADNPLNANTASPSADAQAGALTASAPGNSHSHSNRSSNVPPHRNLSVSDSSVAKEDAVQAYTATSVPVPPAPPQLPASPSSSSHRHTGGLLTQHMGLPLYKPAGPERSLISVDVDDVDEEELSGTVRAASHVQPRLEGSTSRGGMRRRSHEQQRLSLSLSTSRRQGPPPPPPAAAAAALSSVAAEHTADASSLQRDTSYTVHVDDRGNVSLRAATAGVNDEAAGNAAEAGNAPRAETMEAAHPSSYAHPRVEVITLCGEVFVAPVHQTTFWESLTYLDIWLIAYTTMCVWGVGLTMVGNWNIYIMLLARYGDMQQKHYILFAAIAGVSTAGGRVFIGMYERILQIIRERTGVAVVPTVLYPITSVGLLIGTIFWIALPGDKVLVLAYLIGPAFYGISSSITPYVLGTIFDRDLGMHYGFCFFAGAVGFVLCYWCSWYLTYEKETSLTPRGYLCVGQRRCMNRAVGIYVALALSSIFPAYLLHYRYSKLVKGELTQKRVVVPHLMRMFRCCGCGGKDDIESNRDETKEARAGVVDGSESTPYASNPLSTV